MKRFFIALAVMGACLPAAACPDDAVSTASDIAISAQQDKLYAEFEVLLNRVDKARADGKLIKGSPVAVAIAADIRTAKAELKAGNFSSFDAAKARIEANLRSVQ